MLSWRLFVDLMCFDRRWNYWMGGINPRGYHLVNIVLHAAVSVLFAWVMRRCLNNPGQASLFSAVLFAVHPIHTEAVF